MRTFLEETARDLYGRYGDELQSLHILFPSRRARLFFIDALAGIVRRPLWQPHWTTVDELMSEISGLHTADRVRLIAELYKVYSRYHEEPFDKFYFWGDMLLSDFDMVDKYMVDAGMLFRNISDIKELEADVSYLTPEQLRIVSFWGCFRDGDSLSKEKQRFLALWRTLGAIYREYRERLAGLGIAYSGMMHRAAAERLRAGEGLSDEGRRYAAVGFNALSECEKQLFRSLAAAGCADFYWDYDDYYCERQEQEAGMFLRDNIRAFPPSADISHDNMRSTPKEFTSVAAVSNAVQCKYLAAVLGELAARQPGGRLDKETAIVLTDENLLLPVLYSLPESIGKVNVTMGYPLRQSLAYSFVERLIELQSHRRVKRGETMFYHADVLGLLSHPYVADHAPETTARLADDIQRNRRIAIAGRDIAATPLLARIFSPADGRAEIETYLSDVVAAVARLPYDGSDSRQRTEFLAVIAEEIAKIGNSLAECGIDLGTAVYTSLLRRHMQTLRIPFEGEPLEGVQIMGILETRNIDFRNVIILSMNDDNFPGAVAAQSSFIPYNLRAAYSLPTPEHHEGVYAYYFYRLIQRAESVHMLYCSHADEKSTGEKSRYIRQIEYETDFPIRRIEAGVDVNLDPEKSIEIPKSGSVMERLMRFADAEGTAALSPTALYRYVACPLRFYFYSIAGIKAGDDIADDIDAPMFGTILHAAMQTLYGRIEGEHAPGETLRALIRSGAVEQAVEQAINREYLKDDSATGEDYTGSLTLVREIVVRYIRNGVAPYDAAHDDFTVVGLEREVSYDFPFEAADGRRLTVRFRGTADRIDSLGDGALRVVDYKTGAPHLDFASVGTLFEGKPRERLSNIIQTLLYSMMLARREGRPTVPALYYVREMHRPEYSPRIVCRENGGEIRYADCAAEFEKTVAATLRDMFDASLPFRQCEDRDACRYCDYKTICKR